MYRYFDWFGLPGKVVLTVLLSALAVGLWVADPSAPRLLCASAMVLSSCGDLALMRDEAGGRNPLFAGGALFMAAHVCYGLSYGSQAALGGVGWPNTGTWAAAALFAAAFLSLLIFTLKGGRGSVALLVGGLAYLTVISLNCAVIFTYAWGAGGIRLLCGVGALSFFISDYLIGAKLTGLPVFQKSAAKDAVWWFYPIGQALMIIFLR